ncbi:sugar phosphate nucleotidyltransferase [uncultured Bacteroides sp.]|uniref:nucleotidyltransferase family protein n=1 Tax=uncultured Bacteroides sp. TaxID=162156 RepID=UPI002AA6637B|nr:sugar phosphate nucleotidyltransferase [uncultured Bacteroides sp.]
MEYAIIAAGQGSRLIADGVETSKPLLQINGNAILDRLLAIFLDNNAESISIIINAEMIDVRAHLENLRLPVPLHVLVKTTPDSLHSFYELASLIPQRSKLCLTTIDPIFSPLEFSDYIRIFEADNTHDALMAVTDYIDDEKPLYVQTDSQLAITGFVDEAYEGFRYVSGGIYCMNSRVISLLQAAVGSGLSRMRNFQRQMIYSGLKVKAYPFSKIIDVDHASDIRKAELFLNEQK